MTSSERTRLRHQINQKVRERIRRAHGLEEPWTDDPAYIGTRHDRRKRRDGRHPA